MLDERKWSVRWADTKIGACCATRCHYRDKHLGRAVRRDCRHENDARDRRSNDNKCVLKRDDDCPHRFHRRAE